MGNQVSWLLKKSLVLIIRYLLLSCYEGGCVFICSDKKLVFMWLEVLSMSDPCLCRIIAWQVNKRQWRFAIATEGHCVGPNLLTDCTWSTL